MNRSRLLSPKLALTLALGLGLWLAGCQSPVVTAPNTTVGVTVFVDNETRTLTTESLLVRDALAELGLTLNPLDRVTPSEFTPLSEGLLISIVRVTEEFEVEEREVPFEKQTVRNEGLPEGETRLLQIGAAGLEEVTYRIVYEDGLELSRSVVRTTIVGQPVPEIIMVGAQLTFTAIPIQGRLAYLSSGNGWIMIESSGSRRPLTVSGDLDGRVFSLSPSGNYLLYTQNTLPGGLPSGAIPQSFNHLWAISTLNPDANPIDLGVQNVLWAGWSLVAERTLAYSSGEPIAIAPGWRARNELVILSFNANGSLNEAQAVLPPVAEGEDNPYSYGTRFAWAPDGTLAYSQADTIGLVDVGGQRAIPIASFAPFNTNSDWVWNPDIIFSPDGRVLYTVFHGPPTGLETPEDSPVFDLAAIATDGSFDATLVTTAGIWAAPTPDPISNRIAYLQAIAPLDSVSGRYRLAVVDRDGSNPRLLFPAAGEIGLTAQTPAWSPNGERLALIWEGNLWVIDAESGVAQQLTGDGQTSSPSWTP